MKTSLQLKLGQQLTMTPQLQQAIRLLQLSTLDLQQEIQAALDSNPLLESEDEDFASNQKTEPEIGDFDSRLSQEHSSDASPEASEQPSSLEVKENIPDELPVDSNWDDIYQHSSSSTGSGDASDDWQIEAMGPSGESLQDYLLWQLNLTPMSERDQRIAEALIDSVNADGYIKENLQELFTALSQNLATSQDPLEFDELQAVLKRLQQFDPPGICATDLSQCLLTQLPSLQLDDATADLARLLITDHLPALGSRDYAGLMKQLAVSQNQLSRAIEAIKRLNPKPGAGMGLATEEYVIPDVLVYKDRRSQRWQVELNPEVAPKIRINSNYASLARGSSNDGQFLKDQLQEARWLIKSIESRNETLLKVASKIVERQLDFFEQGIECMKPMVLADIAQDIDMHESTISRVTTQKFMHTPRGLFELKYFFSSHVSTAGGGEASSTAIRAIIKTLVSEENRRKPLSDAKLTKLLEAKGIMVARRTVAKYRESMNIAPSNERKSLI